MPAIYSPEWQQALCDLINAREGLAAKAPQSRLLAAIHEDGDGRSPYIPEGEERVFLLQLEVGHVTSEEIPPDAPLPRLDFRFRAPASTFEEVAAGLLDPVDAGLSGRIKVTGDMRILMRYAELVKELLGIYANEIDTTWPLGKPPYDGDGATPKKTRQEALA